jgi:cell division protein FtsB
MALSKKPNRSQLAIGIAVMIALAGGGTIVWGFSQQLALARQMLMGERRLEQAVAAKQVRNDDLVAQLEYASSDEYVEHWARAKAKMAKPEEVAVIVVLTDVDEEPVGEAQPTPAPEPKVQPFWIELWELVFGSPGR